MRRALLALLLSLALIGCGESPDRSNISPTRTTDPPQTTVVQPHTTAPANPETIPETTAEAPPAKPEPAPDYGYTYGRSTGNRIVAGTGDLPGSTPVDIRLGGVPVWVAGVSLGEDTAWVAALEDGQVEAFRLEKSGQATPETITPDLLPPGAPPLTRAEGNSLELVTSDNERASPLTHPVPSSPETRDSLLGVEKDGGLYEEESGANTLDIESLGVTALPDARLTRGGSGEVAALSEPTDDYGHGVLGDGLEASSMTLLRPGEDDLGGEHIRPASGGVFESLSPLWFRAPGIEGDLLAITESAPGLGARISVYDTDGTLVAAGPFMGQPFKWRHLLAAGPFGPNGGVEIAATRTPHVGPQVEFYSINAEAGTLELSATIPGYTSHRIYTRNLDTARAGDFDGDGRWELLVPNESYTALAAIHHDESGARVAWTLPADGTIVTNLASATDSEGRTSIAAGRSDRILRIWRSK